MMSCSLSLRYCSIYHTFEKQHQPGALYLLNTTRLTTARGGATTYYFQKTNDRIPRAGAHDKYSEVRDSNVIQSVPP